MWSAPCRKYPAASAAVDPPRLIEVSSVGIPYWRLSAWYFCYLAFLGGFNPYFSLYLKSLGISALGIGVLLSLINVMRLVTPNLWSWLAEHHGAKMRVIRFSAVASLIVFAGFFQARSFTALFLVTAALAFFFTAALPLVEALTLSHLSHRIESYGRIRLWGSVGFILAVQGVGLMLDMASVDLLLWIGIALLTATLAAALVLPEADLSTVPHAAVDFGVVLRSPQMAALLAAGFFMSAAHAPLYVFYSIHLVDHGYGKTAVGALWSLGVIAEIAVFVWMSWLMRTFSLRAILSVSFALTTIRFLIIGWAIDWPAAAIAAQLMHGVTFGAHHVASVAAINRWFAPRHQARALALYGSVSYGAGGVTGSLLSGYIWDMLGAGTTFSLAAAFGGLGLVLVWRGLRHD